MKPVSYLATAVLVAFGVSACDRGGSPSATNPALMGTWEAEVPDKPDPAGALKTKVSVTFSDGKYQYSWYKKLVGPDNAVVYDWAESARETGSVSMAPDYMQWTADAFGESEYNAATHQWGPIGMKSSNNDAAVFYTLAGNQLTLKEDINLDGDFDDTFETAETMVYTKK